VGASILDTCIGQLRTSAHVSVHHSRIKQATGTNLQGCELNIRVSIL
jgi:hypothetical protein